VIIKGLPGIKALLFPSPCSLPRSVARHPLTFLVDTNLLFTRSALWCHLTATLMPRKLKWTRRDCSALLVAEKDGDKDEAIIGLLKVFHFVYAPFKDIEAIIGFGLVTDLKVDTNTLSDRQENGLL
jgi:hypothetical protein